MPRISLVVCLYKERDLLERLLHQAEGYYDDLVVVHDGPEEAVSAEKRRSVIKDEKSEKGGQANENCRFNVGRKNGG
jgi:glycosyltransferase involved in cell wall biosynthesis